MQAETRTNQRWTARVRIEQVVIHPAADEEKSSAQHVPALRMLAFQAGSPASAR